MNQHNYHSTDEIRRYADEHERDFGRIDDLEAYGPFSACCNNTVTVAGVVTRFYVCDSCKKACDVK